MWTSALPFKAEILLILPPLPGFYAAPLLEASRPSHHLLLPLPRPAPLHRSYFTFETSLPRPSRLAGAVDHRAGRYPSSQLKLHQRGVQEHIPASQPGRASSSLPLLVHKNLPGAVEIDIEMKLIEHIQEEGTRPTELPPGDVTFLSLNRFERKKNVALAIRAFAAAGGNGRLVVAGGWDSRFGRF